MMAPRWVWIGLLLSLGVVGASWADDLPPTPSGEITEIERLRETVELLRGRARQDENQLSMLRAYIRQLELHSVELRARLEKLPPAPKSP